ncbi:MAG: CPCC family cysteine-rich protein [bacterium]
MTSAKEKYPCPCCENKTLDEKAPGTFEICPLCFWEDDNIQAKDPDYTGGTNDVSLNQARENLKTIGCCDPQFKIFARKKILNALIAYEHHPKILAKQLRLFEGDSDKELALLEISDIQAVLDLYLKDKITDEDIQFWAETIEYREDIVYEQEREDVIKKTIFGLANPDINQKITIKLVEQLCKQLIGLIIKK